MDLKACRNFFTVDRKMLPIKLHFTLYSLGISCVMTFYGLIAKNVGISPTAAGIIFTVSPFLTVFTNPSLGWITDKLKKVTLVLIGLIIIQTPLYMGTVFVPQLKPKTPPISLKLTCLPNSVYSLAFLNITSLAYNNTNLKCSFSCWECGYRVNETATGNAPLCAMAITVGTLNTSSGFLQINNVTHVHSGISPNCEEDANNTCEVSCNIVNEVEVKKESEFLSYQFWSLLFLMVSSVVIANATLAIGDAGCFEALEEKVNRFGKERVWLSIGWGAGTLISGFVLDLSTYGHDGKVDFRYSAYLTLVIIVFDIIALSRTNLVKPKASKHIFKDICKLFSSPHPCFFAAVTLLNGVFVAALFKFQFWYLDDMGATKVLLGLSDAMTCIVAEGPFMFISGWIIKRLGRDNCMVLSLSTCAIGFLSLSFINNPWWILLINMSQGPTYGLFIIAMTSYGKVITAVGTEATIQTFFCALYHGLGAGSGSLLSGIAYDFYGPRTTFRAFGFVTIGAAIIYKLLTYFVAGEDTVIPKGLKGNMEMKEAADE